MIGVIGRYITGLFMGRFLGLLFGLTILVIILDLLSHGDEILAVGRPSRAPGTYGMCCAELTRPDGSPISPSQ